jgi:hypothetical protein
MQKYVHAPRNLPFPHWHRFEYDQEIHRRFGSQIQPVITLSVQNIRLHIVACRAVAG